MSSSPQRQRARGSLSVSFLLAVMGLGACAGDVVPGVGQSGLGPDEGEGTAQGEDGDADQPSEEQTEGPGGDGDGAPVDSGDGGAGPVDDGNGDGDVSVDDGQRAGFRLVWRDEFDGAQGTRLDTSRWTYDVGGGGFGNAQLEFNSDRPENVSLDGQGNLAIVARRESFGGNEYTSGRIKTQGLFEQTYGRFESRMKLPTGQGIWPAFWMLGGDIGDVGWPTCGEIDIMENIGREGERVYGTIHGPGYSGAGGIGQPHDPEAQADGYHTYAVEWEENEIRWYVDDVLTQTRRSDQIPGGTRWVFDHPHFIILNLAVGGYWPGNPDGSTVFPQTLSVDYVRVYERE